MIENPGLLHEVQAAPEDDAPRLICADWFEDHGDPPRAEFIRVQIELARMSLWDRRRRALTIREYDLFSKHGSRWSAPLIGAVPRWRYRRGFVEQVKAAPGQFLEHAELLWRHFPVREVQINHPSRRDLARLAASPWLAGVETLDLTFSRMGDAGLGTLLGSPHTHGLRGLVLRWCELTAVGMQMLARTANLPALETLNLKANESAGPAGIAAFLAECRLPRVADVRWGYENWNEDVCTALAASVLMPRVRSLEHFGHSTPADRVHALLVQGRWDGLEELDLSSKSLDRDTGALARNTSLSRLRKLDVSGGPIRDDGLAALARSPGMPNLEEVRVAGCGITSCGVRELAASPSLGRLLFLDLHSNRIGNGGCKALAESKTLTSLQGLNLRECGLPARALKTLVASGLGDRLGYLDVKGNWQFDKQTLSPFQERLGEGLEYQNDDRDWTDWFLAQARANPPRCLSGFAVRADTPLAQRVWKEKLGSDPEYLALELTHPSDPSQQVTLLGYWFRYSGGRLFRSPIAVRWQPSSEVVELFDGEQHGYTGEHGGSSEVMGSGPRIEWKCPHRACRDHTLIACFRYREWAPERPLERYFAPQEQFRMFYLYAWCLRRDAFECVLSQECK